MDELQELLKGSQVLKRKESGGKYVRNCCNYNGVGGSNDECILCGSRHTIISEEYSTMDLNFCEACSKTPYKVQISDLLLKAEHKTRDLNARAANLEAKRPLKDDLLFAEHLMEVYKGENDADLLAEDAFALANKDKDGFKRCKNWISDLNHLRSAQRSSMEDLVRNFSIKIETGRRNIRKNLEEERKRQDLLSLKLQQERQCIKLQLEVEKLREIKEEKDAKIKEYQEMKQKREMDQEMLKMLKVEKEREDAMKLVKEMREREAEAEAKEREKLEMELIEVSRKKREAALQDRIRVNFRRVASAKRDEETKEQQAKLKVSILYFAFC